MKFAYADPPYLGQGRKKYAAHHSDAAIWDTFGKMAGSLRNQTMLDDGAPNLVLAFPGGHGTADMIRRANAAWVPVVRV